MSCSGSTFEVLFLTSTNSLILWHQLAVQQFSSVLTVTIQRWLQPCGLRAMLLTWRAVWHKEVGFLLTRLPLLQMPAAIGDQATYIFFFLYYHQFVIKDTNLEQPWGRDLGGEERQRASSLQTLHLQCVFKTSEKLWTGPFFFDGFIIEA